MIKKNIFSKKIILILIVAISIIFSGSIFAYTQAPSFKEDFAQYLTDTTPDEFGRVETVFNLPIDSNKTLMENIRCLFYPNPSMYPGCSASSSGGFFWDAIRYIGFSVLFIYLVMISITLILNPKEPEKVKNALKSFIYIGYGAFILFGVTRILGTVLNISGVQGSQGLIDKIQGGPNSLLFQALVFLKALAFFLAIVLIVVAGFRIISTNDPDKSKKVAKSIFNIILALIGIKAIDFIYFIAQSSQFATRSADFIVSIAKILGFVIGAVLMIMIFYAGYLLITDQGKEENFKKAKNIIISIFLSATVLFFFLLILYQIFYEFA